VIKQTKGTVFSDWSVLAFIHHLLLLLDVNVCIILARFFYLQRSRIKTDGLDKRFLAA
jgi:hypothetical protein